MKNEIIIADTYDAAIMPGINALVTFDVKNTPRPTSAVVKPEGSDVMALWGDDNDFPQLVIEDVRQDPELPNLLHEKASLIYSGGLAYGKLEIGPDGTEKLVPVDPTLDKEIKDWLRKSNFNRYILEASKDLSWFYNAFPEIVISKDRTKIIQICVQPAEQCRWKKQNESTGAIETCFINANFPDAKVEDKLTKKLPVIDPYYDPASVLMGRKDGFNYIYPLSIPTPGSNYYQLADWNSIRASGWLEVSRAIPKFKKSVLNKQMTIKYHIEISDIFWSSKYEGFDSKSPAEKAILKKTELQNFQNMLTGVDKAGTNIFTPMITDRATGKEFPLWKITVLDDKLKDGTFLEDGKDASLYKYSAMGIHPALLGTMPNNGMGGAGSNIREAYLLYMMKVRALQDIVLEPMNSLIAYYNGWEDVVFRFRNSFMNTLDKGSETTKTVA